MPHTRKARVKEKAFRGQCYWCGEWGHSQNNCTSKDAYMSYMRAYKGGGKGQEVHNVEEGTPSNNHGQDQSNSTSTPTASNLNNLESKGGHRRVLSNLETKNRFSALSRDNDDEDDLDKWIIPPPPGLGKQWTRPTHTKSSPPVNRALPHR